MALDFTSDIMTLFDSKVGSDANYQAPGNFGLATTQVGSVGIDHVDVTVAGSYTTKPTATPSSGSATFQVRMKVVTVSSVGAAGTIYAPGDVLSVSGGTKSVAATLTVAAVKLVSATIAAGGSGYDGGSPSTFNVTVAGGTHGAAAVVSVTTDGTGVVTTVNSVTTPGSYTVLPSLSANAVTGDDGTNHGTGLTLNLVFGVLSATISAAGVYTALPSNPVATTEGGSGTGATFNLAWGVDSLVVTDPGVYEGAAPTINFSAGAAAATAVLASGTTQDTDEKKLLMVVELIRSFVEETTSTVQLKDMAEAMRKMLSAMKFGSPAEYDSSVTADAVVAAAMNYIARNPTHGGASI
jgi:hypothetical protein